jgi:uncharacterized protein (DUF2236 family)
MRVVGGLFGLADGDMPQTSFELEAYIREMLAGDVLFVSDTARRLGIEIVLRPPVSLAARPLVELSNFITVGLLPRQIRRQYGLRWDPLRAATLRLGAEYTRRLLVPVLPANVRYRRRRALPASGGAAA